ncbi:MAG: DUF1080 domain-containing protein [Planctomycetota bacterium]|nr:DUF1080 domain-containing protein [Planctomycetota bacterium]
MMRAAICSSFLILAGTISQRAISQEPKGQQSKRFEDSENWLRLFDGASLSGWTTKGGRYDGNAIWTIEDGAIVGRERKKQGGLLYTSQRFESFVFSLDTKIDYPFDSGIFVHMLPRKNAAGVANGKGMQVTLDYRPQGEIAGIYADGWLFHNPKVKDKWQRDEWNRVIVRCTGKTPLVEVWLNGEKVTEFARQTNEGFTPTGLIGVQVHGGRQDTTAARFKDVRLLELPVFDRVDFTVNADGLLTARDADRWQRLFNGKDLDGWEIVGGTEKGYVVKQGVLGFPKQGGGGYLRTKDDYKDFALRLDFRLAPMANSGLFLRGDREGGDPAWSGCEVQILDDHNWEKVTKSKLLPYQFCGGLYGSVAPSTKALHRPGRWNSYEAHYVGSRIRVELNGQLLYDVDTKEVKVPRGVKPFAERAQSGFIGLQRHAPAHVADGNWIEFRNIFVQRLKQ